MKKVVKVIIMALLALVGALFTAGCVYDFIGLFEKSLKDHGWAHYKKGEGSRLSLKERVNNALMAAHDVMEDVDEGWEWRRS